MKNFTLVLGVDVSKSTLDVTYRLLNQSPVHLQITNDAKGIGELVKLIEGKEKDLTKVLVCCEHTGVYLDKLSFVLKSTPITLWAVHPMIIKGYRLDLNRIKSDKTDSNKIMEFAYAHKHKAVDLHHPSHKTTQLRELFLLKKQLTKLKQQTLNFMATSENKAIPNIFCSMIYNQIKEMYKAYLKAVDSEIIKVIKSDENIQLYYLILQSIPAIGPIISQHMLMVTDCFQRFKNHKQFACFIGISPFVNSSGTIIKKTRTSKKAYQPLKADLHQGVISSIREGQFFNQYYKKMKELNRPHLWIINSIMNMLVKIVFRLIRTKSLFDKNLFISSKKSWIENLQMS